MIDCSTLFVVFLNGGGGNQHVVLTKERITPIIICSFFACREKQGLSSLPRFQCKSMSTKFIKKWKNEFFDEIRGEHRGERCTPFLRPHFHLRIDTGIVLLIIRICKGIEINMDNWVYFWFTIFFDVTGGTEFMWLDAMLCWGCMSK